MNDSFLIKVGLALVVAFSLGELFLQAATLSRVAKLETPVLNTMSSVNEITPATASATPAASGLKKLVPAETSRSAVR